MFLRHFFQKKMQEGDFLLLLFSPFANKNDVPTMFCKKFPTFNKWCRIARAGAPEFKKPHIPVNKANGGQTEKIICEVSMIFTYWNAIKKFYAGGVKVMRAVPEKHIINFLPYFYLFSNHDLINTFYIMCK